MAATLLSILLPTHEYPEGVARILTSCVPSSQTDVEIIVADDSSTDGVEQVVKPFVGTGDRISYRRNTPKLGACENWNALVEAARGDYCVLLHHDEFPVCSDFPREVVRALTEERFPDVLVLRSLVVNESTGRNRLHCPDWLRVEVARRAPGYMLRRNVIGPLSVVVARRALFPRFDPRLTWLIDVDAYYRLFTTASSIRFSRSVMVASIAKRKGSITASLGNGIGRVNRRELLYIEEKYGRCLPASLSGKGSVQGALLRALERASWVLFRGLSRTLWRLRAPPVPAAKMLQRLKVGEIRQGERNHAL